MKRRQFLKGLSAVSLTAALAPTHSFGLGKSQLMKTISGSNELLPVIGVGTWITFDVGDNSAAMDTRTGVLQEFFDMGGKMVDSSPMYGRSQTVIGRCLERIDNDAGLFSATKIWTPGRDRGVHQINASEKLWGIDRFDLMQIHNMVDWRVHLETLQDWKAKGKIRHIGITTSHGRRHRAMKDVIESQDAFDFVQFTYNILDREAEHHLLPLAQEHGKSVIINRPFQAGGLFHRFANKPLPDWAAEIGCENWAQFFLKFVVSHPAVTCAIPATSRVDHMRENMGACYGSLPDADLRARMIAYVESL